MQQIQQILGLSPVERDLYEVLIVSPPVTRTDVDALATEHGWPLGETRAALVRLRELELVTSVPHDPGRYAAAPPHAALDSLLGSHGRQLARARQRLARLSSRFQDSAANEHGTAGDPGDPTVEVVRGTAAMARCLADLTSDVRHEVLGFDAPPYFVDPQQGGNVVRGGVPHPGVMYRLIYDPKSLAFPGRIADLAGARGVEEQARVAELPTKMFLIDRRVAVLPRNGLTEPVDAFVVVRDPGLLAVLHGLFEVYWEHAVPVQILDGQPHANTAELSDSDRRMLSLLVAGSTSRAIAVQLGWGERTVRRRLSLLLRQLGARNRFQAGYLAVTRGWLTTHPLRDGNELPTFPPTAGAPESTP